MNIITPYKSLGLCPIQNIRKLRICYKILELRICYNIIALWPFFKKNSTIQNWSWSWFAWIAYIMYKTYTICTVTLFRIGTRHWIWQNTCILGKKPYLPNAVKQITATAVAQLVGVFAPQAEGWMFEPLAATDLSR